MFFLFENFKPGCLGMLIACCLLSAAVCAQNQPVSKPDSLLKLLATAKEDTNKVNLLDKICEVYKSGAGKLELMQYATRELELSRKLGWIKGQVQALRMLAAAYALNGDFQKRLAHLKDAYELAKKYKLTDQQYAMQKLLVYLYENAKDYEAALYNAKAVMDYYLQFHPKTIDSSNWFVSYVWWESTFEVGKLYSLLKKDSAALSLYHRVWNRFAKEHDSLGIRTAITLFIRHYSDNMTDYENSRKYCFEELKYFKKGDTSAARASVLVYVAVTYSLQKEYVKALEYYRLAMALKPDTRAEVKDMAKSGMRLIYFSLGDYNKALALDLEQLRDATRLNYTEYDKITLYEYIADDYNHLKQYDQALMYLNKELKVSDSLIGVATNPYILLSLANNYYLTHRYDEALLKITESMRAIYYKTDEYAQNRTLLYRGMIVRDAPEAVLRKYGIPAGERYRQSAENIQQALVYFTTHYSMYFLPDCYKELSATYDSMKDYRKFHDTYKKYIALRDSSVNRESQNAFISKLADIQFEKKEDSLKYQQRITNERLREQTLLATQQRKYYLSGIIALLALSFFIGRNYYNQRKANKLISAEKKRSDDLLLNILPVDVAEELKQKGSAGARQFEDVTVLFTDFVNFTTVSQLLTPQELVDELHHCFKAFDDIIGRYGIEKIKTIGDAYLAVAGLPNADAHHAQHAVRAALEIRQFIHQRKVLRGNRSFDIRIGIHSGSVVAGIVGVKKFAYDIWGDTVNTAARMEQHSLPGQINLSEKTYELVKNRFAFTYRGEIEAKNKGALKMYFVVLDQDSQDERIGGLVGEDVSR